ARTLLYVVVNLELSWDSTEALTKSGHDLEDAALEAALAVLKPERLKVDKAQNSEALAAADFVTGAALGAEGLDFFVALAGLGAGESVLLPSSPARYL
nr:hypothetical protein [Tanacetum cinerariifolium]